LSLGSTQSPSGGKPLETLSTADAHAVPVGPQAGAQLPPADVRVKTITVDGKPIRRRCQKPATLQEMT
jgi:hypothetical protein